MNALYLKSIHSQDECLCPVIVNNGNYYFCPCCKRIVDGITEDNKVYVERWLVGAERVIRPKPFLDDKKVNTVERRCFYELLEQETDMILKRISDHTSIESTANILEYKLSSYITSSLPYRMNRILNANNLDKYKNIFLSSYELKKRNIRKH